MEPSVIPESFDHRRPTSEMLLWTYRHGLFPMADLETHEINWYRPDPRGVLPLERFRVRKSLQRILRRGDFEIRGDTAFEEVIRSCAELYREGGWINPALMQPYLRLHELGHAHSVEAWRQDELVGGLYGVHIGGAFFGESMFTLPRRGGSNASKVCLVHLVRWLRHRGFLLLDTQFWNPHLNQFGCIEIPGEQYLDHLYAAVNHPTSWGEFQALDTDESPSVARIRDPDVGADPSSRPG